MTQQEVRGAYRVFVFGLNDERRHRERALARDGGPRRAEAGGKVGGPFAHDRVDFPVPTNPGDSPTRSQSSSARAYTGVKVRLDKRVTLTGLRGNASTRPNRAHQPARREAVR